MSVPNTNDIDKQLTKIKANNGNQSIIIYSDIYKQNIKTYFDYIFYQSIFKNQPWEFEMILDIATKIESGTDFIDIGANIGLITLGVKEMIKNSFPNKIISSYHCFECNPQTFQCLEYNTSFYPNMYNYSFALSNQIGICEMGINPFNYGGNFVSNMNNSERVINPYNLNAETNPKTKIAMISLDHILSVFTNKIGCMKIDVEGFEKQVLEGAQQLIIRDKPILVIEVWEEHKESIDAFLHSLHYQITKVHKDEFGKDFNYIYEYRPPFEISIL